MTTEASSGDEDVWSVSLSDCDEVSHLLLHGESNLSHVCNYRSGDFVVLLMEAAVVSALSFPTCSKKSLMVLVLLVQVCPTH